MKVRDLAEELDVPVEKIKELSGKTQDNAILTKQDVDNVVKALSPDDEAAEKPAPKPRDPNIVRLWSLVRKHRVPVTDPATQQSVLVAFDDYSLLVRKDSPTYKALKALNASDIFVVVDKGFENLGDIKNFRALLEDHVFTGPHREPSAVRGLSLLRALFHNEESELWARTFNDYGVEGLIELAVRNKSYFRFNELA